MTNFSFNTDTWQVAWHHGHSAFRLLRIVYEIETEYKANFDSLGQLEYGRLEYLHTLSRNHTLTIDMFRISSASIMMFQSMMEAEINDCIEKDQRLIAIKSRISKNKRDNNFRFKWEESLTELRQDTSTFMIYFESIYKKYRNPLVHPKKVNLDAFNNLSFKTLLYGYQNGWEAGVKLLEGLGHQPFPDSWNNMCNIYQIPPND